MMTKYYNEQPDEFDLAVCGKIIEAEMTMIDKKEDEQVICSICGNDIYKKDIFVTHKSFISHFTCYVKGTNRDAVERT